MPPRGSLVRSFLGEASLRIQRLLELDALVSPAYDTGEKIIPVVLVGDGDRPGMGDQRGRRFWAGGGGVLAAGQAVMFGLLAGSDPLQLDRVVLYSSAVTRLQVQIIFGAAAGVTSSNSYLDNVQAVTPVPGLSMSVPVVGAGTTIGNAGVNTAQGGALPLDVLLTPNMSILFSTISAVTLDVWLHGRSF